MKMQNGTSVIEIYDINKTKGGYEAEYSTGEADVTLEIETSQLAAYISDNELNLVEDINPALFSMECDGLDQYYTDPYVHLEENYYEVISQYLNDLHSC